MDGIGPDQLTIKELLARIAKGDVSEVIMATNPTVEGGSDRNVYCQAAQAPWRQSQSVSLWHSVGGNLEYADEVTLWRAMEGRSEL